jgi:hypothetical protein
VGSIIEILFVPDTEFTLDWLIATALISQKTIDNVQNLPIMGEILSVAEQPNPALEEHYHELMLLRS